MFGTTPSFEVDGESSLNSFAGAFVSIVILVFTTLYIITRTLIWYHNEDTAHQSSILLDVNKEHTFLYEETNFNFAFNLIGLYDYEPRDLDIEGYINIDVELFTFLDSKPDRIKLGTHACTVEEK